VSRIKVNCFTRWKKDFLICLCKVGNPACDRHKTCEILEFEHDKYKDLKGCMNERKYKKVNGKVKQI